MTQISQNWLVLWYKRTVIHRWWMVGRENDLYFMKVGAKQFRR